MRYSIVKSVTALCLFSAVMAAMLTLREHVMFYQEQHWLFLYSAEYVASTLRTDGPVALLGAFVIQFYHVPWLGAAIVAALLTAVSLIAGSLIRRVTGMRDLLQLGTAGAVALFFTLDSIDSTPGWAVVAVIGLAVLRLAACLLPGRKPVDKPLSTVKFAVALVMAGVWIGGGYWLQVRDYDRAERAMLLAHRAVIRGDWDTAITITENYLATGRNNRLMQYFRCLARARRGELVEHLFDYPLRQGVDALVFPWKGDSRESEYGHMVHEATGNLNAAHHWAFEAMTVWGETAPHLTDLARYNIAMGRPRVAQRFVNKLAQSLFYRDEAAALQRQIDGTEPPELHYAWTGITEPETRFINVLNPVRDLMEIVRADSANRIARQYLKAVLLAANDQDALVTVADRGVTEADPVEEAKLVYSLYPYSTPLDSLGLTLSERTKDRFARMKRVMGPAAREQYEKEFGRSFWYYIYNYCPYGADKRNSLPSDTIIPGAELRH